MATTLRGNEIAAWAGDDGNEIKGQPELAEWSTIEFHGTDNKVIFRQGAKLHGNFVLRGSNSTIVIGKFTGIRGRITVGSFCKVVFGQAVYCGPDLYMSAAEGTKIVIGGDSLIAASCRFRSDDSHPIYDGVTGERINKSRSIKVGEHVWIGQEVFLMPGAEIGEGSVVGARSVVTKSRPIPPHVLALGSPAAVQRRGIRWVRQHLQTDDIAESIEPIFAPDAFGAEVRNGAQRSMLGRLRDRLRRR